MAGEDQHRAEQEAAGQAQPGQQSQRLGNPAVAPAGERLKQQRRHDASPQQAAERLAKAPLVEWTADHRAAVGAEAEQQRQLRPQR